MSGLAFKILSQVDGLTHIYVTSETERLKTGLKAWEEEDCVFYCEFNNPQKTDIAYNQLLKHVREHGLKMQLSSNSYVTDRNPRLIFRIDLDYLQPGCARKKTPLELLQHAIKAMPQEPTTLGKEITIVQVSREQEHYDFATVGNPKLNYTSLLVQPKQPISNVTVTAKEVASQARISLFYLPKEGETLAIQGTGPGMDGWKIPVPLKWMGDGVWVWQSDTTPHEFEYKIVRFDKTGQAHWEQGKNHQIQPGLAVTITPQF